MPLMNCKCGTSGVNDVCPECPVHGRGDYVGDGPFCRTCGGTMRVDTAALRFLHQQLHSEPWGDWPLGNAMNLNGLPYCLFDRVAKLMQDYESARSINGEMQP
jgi:hypothetical protein